MFPEKSLDPRWVLNSIYNGIVAINAERFMAYFNKNLIKGLSFDIFFIILI